MGTAQSARWGRQLVCRSGDTELKASRGQMATYTMAIALMGVPPSFAVAIHYGATAQREIPPLLLLSTLTHHMCTCRLLMVERLVPQAEVSASKLKTECNRSTNTSRKRAIKSARWGEHMVRCYVRITSCLACTCVTRVYTHVAGSYFLCPSATALIPAAQDISVSSCT